MNYLKAGISFLILLAVIISLNTKFGSVPPLGKFFDPHAGFWANAETTAPQSQELDIPGLKDIVSVYFDDRRVPHIFAQNEHDLYLAQGYIVARDRLFQMEMQTYDAAGRLAEIIGPSLLNRDKQTRRWGMPFGAERAWQEIQKDPDMLAVIEAYADGVNAYIDELSPDEYPLEYKILDFTPEPWEPIKTALLLKNMTRTLAAGNRDDRTSNTLAYFGDDFVNRFFTREPELNDPIIPPSREWDFDADIPEAPDSLYVPASAKEIEAFTTEEGIGSNNWAVSGSKTASGYPILANDPHLSLTLPSIWYEVQLHAPGVNTYGVSLQGSPGVIIGFNEDVAWGVTNVGTDVLDWYEIEFRDETMQEYRHDGQWKPTSTRIEEVKVRGEETVMDTVIYTHHGPVTKVESRVNEDRAPAYHAMRWIAHEPSNDLKTFYGLNRAENYDDYVAALKEYTAPAQNFVFASNEGDIAIWVNGKLPKKWEHQGRTVSDGTDPSYDWQGWIPRDQIPHIKNPDRGFVSSANQESAAPDYPYYLDDDFAPFERGRRINDLLESMENITPKDMQDMQMDDYSYYASTFLPSLLAWTDTDSLTEEEQTIYDLMTQWNYYMDAEEMAPAIFRQWAGNFYRAVMYDEYETTDALLRYPSRDIFVEVVKNDPDFSFIDNIETEARETREDIATATLKESVSELTNAWGEPGDRWKWGVAINNDIDHLANVPGMGKQNIYSSGSSDAINAIRGGFGPSWRMVVELGPEVKGWGVYPGGASGNPGSPNYDSMIETWRTGGLFELNFFQEEPSEFNYKISLKNPGSD
ncbi:MAG: penicillin acylase family protein [Gracilimonas sp.]|uniref:penicillin acylase family protein n=1 Tax=Gracilimonas TaxID=649462 RepID=UPI001B29A92D|nr:penicillin acylase family protein [Gracilimonas sp.]MBO6585066.1 penicillin acylase family protein [Gracilimonas sp.]MBO6615663.1 penicillin acylase family protein [Gracilimonas sp.]